MDHSQTEHVQISKTEFEIIFVFQKTNGNWEALDKINDWQMSKNPSNDASIIDAQGGYWKIWLTHLKPQKYKFFRKKWYLCEFASSKQKLSYPGPVCAPKGLFKALQKVANFFLNW